ncbi:hypothetical protein CEP52_011715 [Fusarium oligoseptatum]|uniref:Histone H2A/H2B/H3 domain-containing protein n=1 Tax=Fusarium oligoseptatum TaxID=2604345 RepID=A0A428T1V7_9HYPO|nr:hypothetical protein CEP52_011715 [Fusarium oligoseptatum]
MLSTPPAQQVPKATTGKRPPTRKRKRIRRSPQPRPRSARFIPPWTMTHPEPLSLRDMRNVPDDATTHGARMAVDHFLEFQIKPRALSLLQKEAERFIIKRFTSANNFAERMGRTTIEVQDVKRADELREMFKQLGIPALKALAVSEKFKRAL